LIKSILFVHVLAIITEGGEKVNIIPEKAVIQVCVRAPTNKEMEDLKAKVTEILKSSATANGCQVFVNIDY
jgi:metal-dependent amidase/aminoacylase/carboxypeptidase family protein